jgi:hypothetical protein
MAVIIPQTELDAVNLILANSGDVKVNSLSGSLPLEASIARDTLTEVSRDVQSRGWYFNTEVYRLQPAGDGTISVPTNTLAAQSYGNNRGTPVTIRNGALYNLTPFETGPTFEAAMEVKLVLGLDMVDLPPTARRYITLRAARVFQIRESGDELSAQEDNADEQRALAELHAEQLQAEPLTLRSAASVYDVISLRPYPAAFSWRS